MMPRETPSPIDLPGPARLGPGGLRWSAIVIATAALVLLPTNAIALKAWIDEQRPGPLQARVASLADSWVAFTDRAGLGSPRAALHERWKRAEAARFASSDAQR